MTRFADPNYQILLEYFTKFVKTATGSQHSYLIGPNRTVASLGGVDTTLYEKTIDRGFVGHKFKLVEIEGNRFKMKYNGLESTFSLATSAVNISDEMYFRKDSFFHFWLSRQPQYENYVNLERTFSFFGKIWPVTGFSDVYSIEFEGMKDFSVRAIPTHNQTINLVEFIQTYFDRVHHEVYTMTKTLWSLFDPREVNIKWLRYIARIYGLEIDENLNEQSLREWVENLIYLLKRVGTYNAIYIIGRLFLGDTPNKLNVYERWGEWCRQVSSEAEGFRDYHFLEFYGVHPSGGAGSSWYDNFNPDNVPVSHIHVNNGPPPYPTHTVLGPISNELIKSEELVFNGDFSDLNRNWGVVIDPIPNGPPSGGRYDQISFTSFSNPFKLRCKRWSPSGNSYAYQNIPTIPGDTYILSFLTKGVVDTPGGGIDFPNFDGRYSIYDLSNLTDVVTVTPTGVSGTAFEEVTRTFIAPPNCFKISVRFWVPAFIDDPLSIFWWTYVDGVYYDNISLTHEVRSNCDSLAWDCGYALNYFEFTGTLLNCSVSDIDTDTIALSAFKSTSTQTFALSGQNITGDFKSCAGIISSTYPILSTEKSEIVFWGLANEGNGMDYITGNYIAISFFVENQSSYVGNRNLYKFRVYEKFGAQNGYTESVWLDYAQNTPYYLTIVRSSSTLLVYIYSEERRNHKDLIEIVSRPLYGISSYTVVHAVNSFIPPPSVDYVPFTGQLFSINLTNVHDTLSVSVSGFPVMTPHYIVEVDLSSKALGSDYIISETLIRDLYQNWEYIRPVMKYAHYRELIAPIASTTTSEAISLYDTTGNVGTLTTEFIGNRTPSAGQFVFGNNTTAYFQNIMTKIWTVTHGLSATNLIVQSFRVMNVRTGKLEQIFPESIEILDNQTVKLTFKESVRGFALVAGPSDFGVTYDHIQGGASSIWSISHNLTTNSPSGYSVSAGPLMMAWNSDMNVIPSASYILSPDNLEVTFDVPLDGTALVKRSDFIHQQTSLSDIWTIEHKLNDFILIQTYDKFGMQIYPKSVRLINDNRCIVTFSKPQTGTAHIAASKRSQIAFSGFDCDITGLGFCPGTLGYWKVGTGIAENWDAEFYNDLESPIVSGAYLDLYEDTNWWYLDFEVPSFVDDISVTEVGLFNFNNELIFYTKCSPIFKIKNVSTFFHYRIEKIYSSSSSSSYSSSSRSSSSSSSSSSKSSSSSSSSSSSRSSSSSSSKSSSSSSSSSSRSSSSSSSRSSSSSSSNYCIDCEDLFIFNVVDSNGDITVLSECDLEII